MPTTAKGTPYVVSTDLVANYPTVSSDLADHIDDNLQYSAQDINAQTGSGANAYTFALADASLYKLVTASNAAAATYTVPPQSSVTWANGAVLRILNQGAGVVTLAGGSGVTLNGSVLSLNQYQYAEIHRTASNSWTVVGISTAPGLVLISPSSIANSGGSASATGGAVTFSGVTSVSLNGVFSSTYDVYRIELFGTVASGPQNIHARLRLSGTDATGTDYFIQHVVGGGINVTAARTSSSNAGLRAGYFGTAIASSAIDIYRPGTAHTTAAITQNVFEATASCELWHFGSGHNVATAYDGITFYPAASTLTGTVRIYGYRN